MKDNQPKSRKHSERATGDLLLYFLSHNFISMMFFFLITINIGIYAGKYTSLAFIFSMEFLELTLFKVFPIIILSGVIGRITALGIMRGYNRWQKRATKRWSELQRGINKIGLRYIITVLITSFLYTAGVVAILSYAIFNETALLSLMITYSFLKIGTYFIVRYLVGSKL